MAVPIFLELAGNPQVLTSRGFEGTVLVLFALGLGWLPLLRLLVPRGFKLESWLAAPLLCLMALGAVRPLFDSVWGVLLGCLIGGFATVLLVGEKNLAKLLAGLGAVSLLAPLVFLLSGPVVTRWGHVEKPVYPAPWGSAEGPLVVVIFDAFPLGSLLQEGGLDRQRFPNFARLAADGVWYQGATTVADYTTLAVPPILTGLHPSVGAELSPASYPRNLYTYLSDRPLKTVGIAAGLCPNELRSGGPRSLGGIASDAGVLYAHRTLPTSLTAWLPAADSLIEPDFESRMSGRLERYQQLIAGLAEQPNEVAILHLLFPHIPFEHYPDGTRYNNEERRWNPTRPPQEWLAKLDLQRHLMQVELADRLLGQVLDRLASQGLYDKATIAVLADHGVAFQANEPRRTMSTGNYPALLRVPMFLKAPGLEGGLVDLRPVETIDLVPTLCQLLGGTPDQEWDGHSLLDDQWAGRPHKQVSLIRPDSFLPEPHYSGPLELKAKPGTTAQVEKGRVTLDQGDIPWPTPLEQDLPFAELLGQEVSTLTVLSSDTKVALKQPTLYQTVELQSGFVPGLLQAELTLEGPTSETVMVALHGKLVASGQTVPQGDRHLLKLMLPLSAFREGENQPSLYLTREGPQLLSMANHDGYSWQDGRLFWGAQQLSENPDGAGQWQVWHDNEGDLRLDGWCYDKKEQRVPSQVVVFRGGKLLLSGAPGLPVRYLPNVAMKERVGADIGSRTLAGFLFDLGGSAHAQVKPEQLRVFAVDGRKFIPLDPY